MLLLKNTEVEMASTRLNLKLIFAGFLISFVLVPSAVVTQSTKMYSQSNSASWQGKSSFKDFWPLKSQNDHPADGQDDLLLKLFKLLTKQNAAFKRLEYSDILAAAAKLDINITETQSKMSSVVTLHIVLNTTQNANSGSDVDTTASNETPDSDTNGQSVKNSQPNSFDKKVLDRHNFYRKKHGVPPLTYNKQISQVSQAWANKLARNEEFKHSYNPKYGENLYSFWHSNPNQQLSPNAAVDAWYDEIKMYTYSNNPVLKDTGHFTQVVWKNSKYLGIGVAKSKSNRYYVVCNYSPPGNIVGQYQQNVPRPV